MLFNIEEESTPRASRIVLPGEAAFRTELWIGGARAAHGEIVGLEAVRDAWIIDCAKDMPGAHLAAAASAIYRVFIDTEDMPPNYAGLAALASSVAGSINGTLMADELWRDHPLEPPRRIYVMCTYGLNRSALMMGRILRALGVPGDEAISAIRAARPGAFANVTYERIVRE